MAAASAWDRYEGLVVDAESGTPISNARIVGLDSRRVAVTGMDGRFVLDGQSRIASGGGPELSISVTGFRVQAADEGWEVERIAADGRTENVGTTPLAWDASRLPSGIGWLRLRRDGQSAIFQVCRIPGQLRLRRLHGERFATPRGAATPESLFVRLPGGAMRLVQGIGDSAMRIELPEVSQVAGDFHTHTFLTDGSHTLDDVAAHAFGGRWTDPGRDPSTAPGTGLDWFANSEHGGYFSRDRFGKGMAGGGMWRWRSLRELSWPAVDSLRQAYPGKFLFQGMEWNVPSHEHASVAILTSDREAIARFEFLFDANDGDAVGGGWPDAGTKRFENDHAKALAGASWLRRNHPDSSWLLVNHPSRLQLTSVEALRDLHDSAGAVFLGIEAIPGHQFQGWRGGYHLPDTDPSGRMIARTYGGVDPMLAFVGGAMDALWSEGRRVWVFANSDFHNRPGGDPYPGEYNKNLTRILERTPGGILAGLRSGATVAVMGDLVDSFSFELDDGLRAASMGGELATRSDSVEVVVRFHVPSRNVLGDSPFLDHLDLIGGKVGKELGSPRSDSAPATRLVSSVQFGGVEPGPQGWHTARWKVAVDGDAYFRIRGTSMARGVEGWTDAEGNPLCDDLQYPNTADKARRNLWLYSNPIFLRRLPR